MSKNGQNFFRLQDQQVYIGSGNLNQKLDPGVYTMKYNPRQSEVFIEAAAAAKIDKTSKTKQLVEILGIVSKFSQNVKSGLFDKHEFKSKFGIMLEGPPGTGKSQTVNNCANQFVADGGIVVFIGDNAVIHSGMAGQYLKKLNSIQPSTPILLVLEDIDSLPPQLEVYLTSILDGEQSPSNTFFLGTTNFVSQISQRILRPGRFDLIYKIAGLDSKTRIKYINDKLKEFSINVSEEEKALLHSTTDGYSFAEIRTFMAYVGFFGFEAKDLASKIARMDGSTQDDGPEIDEYDCPEDYMTYDEED